MDQREGERISEFGTDGAKIEGNGYKVSIYDGLPAANNVKECQTDVYLGKGRYLDPLCNCYRLGHVVASCLLMLSPVIVLYARMVGGGVALGV